jgi:hypothetical protein
MLGSKQVIAFFERTMMSVQLPQPVAQYLAADACDDFELVLASFTPDAVVHDEGSDIVGGAAIDAWKREARQKYQYTVTPLSSSQSGETVSMRARLEGNFPGSPVDVTYTFVLAGALIASMKID